MSNPVSSENASNQAAASDIVDKLKAALQRDGDFPASAKLVGELRMLVSDPKTTANQVTEVILREPSLGTRVLHLVNSSFYRRAKPIMTVSQAVIQIGMRPLAELCAGLILLQKFIPAARGGGSFASCLQGTILTSLLTSSLSAAGGSNGPQSKADETAYLAGSFCELGTLLLAFYFPKVYESALKRAETKRQELGKSLQEITGLSPVELSLVVVDALKLPAMYQETLSLTNDLSLGKKVEESKINNPALKLASSLFAAQKISSVLVHKGKKEELDATLAILGKSANIDAQILKNVVGDLPTIFKSHCSSLDISCPALPEFVAHYAENSAVAENSEAAAASASGSQFTHFVEEIREAVESGEPTASIITRAMETFAWSLGFSRVLLLLIAPGKRKLVGRMLLGGAEDVNPRSMERSMGSEAGPFAPDAVAFREARPVFSGDSILPDGWPLVAIPIGFGARCIGVIYADKVNSDCQELESWESAACGVLAELLDRSVVMHSK